MTTVRIMADDLTGALDVAAEFAALAAPLHAFWHDGCPPKGRGGALPRSAALDTGTREVQAAAAGARVAGLVPLLAAGGIAFKKVDSLMRGPTLAELAACFAAGSWASCAFAPAFPYQGRVTRGGWQHARGADGAWSAVGPDLAAALRGAGVAARPGRLDAPLPPGISVFDADTDADLDAVVAHARRAGPVLWCGTGGLARAVAQACGQAEAVASATLPRPVLGLFGSDHAATAVQLAACGRHWMPLPDGGADSAARLARQLADDGVALVSLDLPMGLDRRDAATRIGCVLRQLNGQVRQIARPGTLLVAGGETLHGLCVAMGAASLELQGRIAPGLPRSVLRGGPWDGTAVVSKSGAFGPAHLLRDLLRHNGFDVEGTN